MFGWSGFILRLDLSNKKSSVESVEPYKYDFIGGRGINVKILFDEAYPSISPYDPNNRLIFGPGVLTGTTVPSASRMKVTTILPNGCMASSGIGGFIGSEIRYAGYDNIIIQGKAEVPVYIYLHDDIVEFRDAAHLWGKDTWQTQQTIKKELSDSDVKIMCIGPGGENLISFSCIVTGMFSAAGHGGFGAIMGSKNLKAVVVRGKRAINIAKLDTFLEVSLEARIAVMDSPGCKAMVDGSGKNNAAGAIKSGRAVFGNWEEWTENSAAEYGEKALKFWRQYSVSSVGCAGCPMYHFKIFDVPGIGIGAPKCGAWGAAFSTPLWNSDYDLMFHCGLLCNQYGLDFVSIANIIGFLTSLFHQGIITKQDTDGIVIERGNRDAIITLIHKIAKQEGCGELLKSGVLNAANEMGRNAKDYVAHVKGLEMSALECRAFKATALAYAICKDPVEAIPIPEYLWAEAREPAEKLAADLCGDPKAANPDSYDSKGHLVWEMENRITAVDMLGVCKFHLLNVTPFLEILARLFSFATGTDTSEIDLLIAAQRVRTLERAFNTTRGISRENDTLPVRMFDEPVSGGPHNGKRLNKNNFNGMIDEYYELSGWDKNGIPKEETFKKLGLSSEWQVFNSRMNREVKSNDQSPNDKQ